ncbi:putative ribonuclease III [Rosa chinensis]|uniref:Putative ribonuclease III n=1 Tax=Rosa chinensis TaxID=74649 RepID=A0A2P6PPU4_ROSCH|nr:mini-ribonuclease 3 isoform X1 [Rosa chinensis]PRQ23949.1 putative ribonuclease III [Rosa chinensis]
MHAISVPSPMSVRVVRVGASWDTQQRLPYNRNAPRKLKQTPSSTTIPTTETPPTVSLTASTTRTADHVFELLKRPTQEERVRMDELYMGYDRWLPSPPKVQKPSSPKVQKPSTPKVQKPQTVLNAVSLAYLGDCIYELYARRHFLFPPLSIEEYNDRVMAVVRCEAQDALLQRLLKDNFLSEEERNVLRWGKNISSAKTRTKKRAGAAVYNRASSLETLVGHLYLTDVKRLEEVMVKLGFSTDSSMQLTSEDANGKSAPASEDANGQAS